MIYFFLFIFGLAVGSFLNVVSLRYQPNQTLLDLRIIGGRSKCQICHKELAWHELIPLLSFFIQAGKCRHCGCRISLQYPIVEAISGLIFVFVPLSLIKLFPYVLNSKFYIFVVSVWILIFLLFLVFSIIDFRHSIIPDQINLSLAVLGIILMILHSSLFVDSDVFVISNRSSFLGHYASLFDFFPQTAFSGAWLIIVNRLIAVLFALAFFGGIILLSRGRAMGWGDFKLAGALGLIFGWPDILIITLLSFIVGSVFAAPFLISGRKKMKDAIPFGPFLAASSALVFFFGFQIMNGYFRLFGL